MEITAALAAELDLLTAALYDPTAKPTTDLAETILVLATDARLAVQSFLGLTITITGHADGAHQVALRCTLLDDHADPHDIKTSLRLPRPTDRAAPGRPNVETVLYAATPGAFVDMAADLTYLTGRTSTADDLDQHRGLALEADITGVLPTQTTIGEAIGVLIARGRTHEQAHTELDTLAEAAHTPRTAAAARILATLTHDTPEAPAA